MAQVHFSFLRKPCKTSMILKMAMDLLPRLINWISYWITIKCLNCLCTWPPWTVSTRWYVTQMILFFGSSSMSLTVSSLSIFLSYKSTSKSSMYPGAAYLGFNGTKECYQYSFWKILRPNKCKRAKLVCSRSGTLWSKRALSQTSYLGACFISSLFIYLPFTNRYFLTLIMRKKCLMQSYKRPAQYSKQTRTSSTKLRNITSQMLNKIITTKYQCHTGIKRNKIFRQLKINNKSKTKLPIVRASANKQPPTIYNQRGPSSTSLKD